MEPRSRGLFNLGRSFSSPWQNTPFQAARSIGVASGAPAESRTFAGNLLKTARQYKQNRHFWAPRPQPPLGLSRPPKTPIQALKRLPRLPLIRVHFCPFPRVRQPARRPRAQFATRKWQFASFSFFAHES